jgi:hypothetical protein
VFVEAIVISFGEEYLPKPTATNVHKQLETNKARRFSKMFGSLDCTHWSWHSCQVGQQGLYVSKDGKISMILEAIAAYNSWIWHSVGRL